MVSESFGGYVLLDRIATGGMAEVLRAKTVGCDGFERMVAIKRILAASADDDANTMLIDEARISAQLHHDNIIQTFDLGLVDSQYFIAMEYLFSRNLRRVLLDLERSEDGLGIPAAAYIASAIASGLDYAHNKTDPAGNPLRIVHRDVSPHNILIGFGGEVKLADFGIALADKRTTQTHAGILKGKFAYMSPEQLRGKKPDHRGDIFGLGIVLWEMLAGRQLFIDDDAFKVLDKIRNADVEPPSRHNQDVPPELDAVVMKMLARKPEDRVQRAGDVADALQPFLTLNASVFSPRQLAGVMSRLYPAAIAEEQRLLRRWRESEPDPEQVTLIWDSVETHNHESSEDATQAMVASSERDGESQGDAAVEHSAVAEHGRPVVVPLDSPSPNQRRVRFSWPRVQTGWAVALFIVSVLTASVALASMMRQRAEGTMVVTSTPDREVTVILDGMVVARSTPVVIRELSPGAHEVELHGYGKHLQRQVRVVDRETEVVAFQLVAPDPTPPEPTPDSEPTSGLAAVAEMTDSAPTSSRDEVAEMTDSAPTSSLNEVAEVTVPTRSDISTPPDGVEASIPPDETPSAAELAPTASVEAPALVCGGSGAELSVFVHGQADCRIFIAGREIGYSPFYKQPAPVGKCEVRMICPGRTIVQNHRLVAGHHTKVIVPVKAHVKALQGALTAMRRSP